MGRKKASSKKTTTAPVELEAPQVEEVVKVEEPKLEPVVVPPPVPVAPKETVFKVAKGKSLTSLKGIVSEDTVITDKFFSGGKEVFQKLVEKGYIVAE